MGIDSSISPITILGNKTFDIIFESFLSTLRNSWKKEIVYIEIVEENRRVDMSIMNCLPI